MSEILYRDSQVSSIDFAERIIEVIAVPWDEETTVFWRGEPWGEVFRRGAFAGLEKDPSRVRVNREHERGNTIGKLVEVDPKHETGLFARMYIAPTTRGDETLVLAREGMISASIGYRANKPSDVKLHKNRTPKLREVITGFLDHLAMVESPAFAGAHVLAAYDSESQHPEADGPPLNQTPALDAAMSDEVLGWAEARIRNQPLHSQQG